MSTLTDYSVDLSRLTALATTPAALEDLLAQALRSLRKIIPHDLATIFERDGDFLVVRATEGPLVNQRIRTHRLWLQDFPTVRGAIEGRRPVSMSERDHASEGGEPYDGILDLPHGHSCMIVPLHAGPRSLGIITLERETCDGYPPEAVEMAAVYGEIVSFAMMFAEQAFLLDRYRHRLEEQNRLLREEVRGNTLACHMLEVTQSPRMKDLMHLARHVARSDMPVLIDGETGTGKEVLAHAVHAWSPRVDGPFVTLNCTAITENLVESELFGHVKGAFSGAVGDRSGRFVTANGGTLFIDEIGDMPLSVQGKLLRVLQEGTFESLGSDKSIRVDVRVIAATHLDLRHAVHSGQFREDLFERLAGFPLHLPPLRDRVEDILPISRQFLDELHRRRGIGPWTIGDDAARALIEFTWPGNVRQLVNTLERATILQVSGQIDVEHLALERSAVGALSDKPVSRTPGNGAAHNGPFLSFVDNERLHLRRALERTNGKIYGKDGAAELLGLRPTTLQSKLRKHSLK